MLHGVLLTWFHFSSLCEELRKASVPPRGPGHRSAHLLGLMGLQRAWPGREQGRVQPQLCPSRCGGNGSPPALQPDP